MTTSTTTRTALLHDAAFCPYETLRLFAQEHNNKPHRNGALASFCGIARAQRQEQKPEQKPGRESGHQEKSSDALQSLYLDCYPDMAIRSLEEIVCEAQTRWHLDAATIHHRIGDIPVGETIVLVACLSARRNDAFDACRYMTDMVKIRPPLWKREQTLGGEQAWLDANADDSRRAACWQKGLSTREAARHIS